MVTVAVCVIPSESEELSEELSEEESSSRFRRLDSARAKIQKIPPQKKHQRTQVAQQFAEYRVRGRCVSVKAGARVQRSHGAYVARRHGSGGAWPACIGGHPHAAPTHSNGITHAGLATPFLRCKQQHGRTS